MLSANAPMAGYPKAYNVEMDPHEDLDVTALFGWVGDPALKEVGIYLEVGGEISKPARAEPFTIPWRLMD